MEDIAWVLPSTLNDDEDNKDKVDSTESDDADQQCSPGPVTERAQERLVEDHVVPPYKQSRVKVPDNLGHLVKTPVCPLKYHSKYSQPARVEFKCLVNSGQ